MFRTVSLSIIRSLFTVHSAMVYVIQVCEISASSWFYYKEIFYGARSHGRKIPVLPEDPLQTPFYLPSYDLPKEGLCFPLLILPLLDS